MEELSSTPCLSLDNQRVESIFSSTTTRTAEGKFVVVLPKVENPTPLGDSYKAAFNRFLNLEKRFARNPTLFKRYYDFLNEYLQLDHMIKTSPEEIPEITIFCIMRSSKKIVVRRRSELSSTVLAKPAQMFP